MTQLLDRICGALEELDIQRFNEACWKCDEDGGRRSRI